ncbi:flavodoxin domain-containing protein [uncultured Draconibacterium sp.]|uniref:flavodoxin domain-containing protein n=1 Tax=uncultured Draconibacterium sp. TaxID=1573823 RepID=UPI0032163402
MKTLIAYSTTHGCTEKTANELKSFLGGSVQLVNLKQNPQLKISDYDKIIIGGSIHAGRVQKSVKDFCAKNLNELQEKELGLFICCMEEGEKARTQLFNAFPEELHQKAKAEAYFGGEFSFEKMNFFQKMIVKKVAKIEHSTSKIDHEAIRTFSKKMNKIFNPFLFLI